MKTEDRLKRIKKFRAGFSDYKVSRKLQTVLLDGRELVGYCDPTEKLIWICPESPDPLQTFGHEWAHALFGECGVRQAKGWNEDIEEILCETIGNALKSLLEQMK